MPIFFTKEKIMPSWQAPRTPPINSLWKETKTRRIKVLDYQKQPENIHLSLFLTRLLQLCDFIWGTWRLSYTRSSNLLVFCWRRWKVIFQTVGCDIPRKFKWDEIWWVGQPRHVFHINLRLWKQYSERSVHCHSEGSAPIRGREESWGIGWGRLLRVTLCLPCPLIVWADTSHSWEKLSHLLSTYTCKATTDSLFFTQPGQSGLQRTHLAWGKQHSKQNNN